MLKCLIVRKKELSKMGGPASALLVGGTVVTKGWKIYKK